MPTLNWIGKEAVINHDKEVPFKLLKKIETQSIGKSSKNLVIQGDNLEALKALMPFYCDKIKCVYIDPPYNTGHEDWKYNDNVNSKRIKKWLGKTVGAQAEDLCRHDKWLCMMYPRLKLLRNLLSDDGSIFVSIDDNELMNLLYIMNEIFGEENFIATIIWQKKYAASNDNKYISNVHEYLIVFAKNKLNWKPNLFERPAELNAKYKNPDNDPRGPWYSTNLSVKTFSEKNYYPIISPKGKKFLPPPSRCWVVSKEKYKELLDDNRIWFGKDGTSRPYQKKFLSEVQKGIVPTTMWLHTEAGHNIGAKSSLREIFKGETDLFNTPKPEKLIKRILQLATNDGDLVLDSFAGSGTTGQAVIDQNHEDGKNRNFILIELEENIANKVTAERLKRIIKQKKYNAGFEFCKLEKPLFNESGKIDESCSFEQLATYIFFTETQTNIDKKEISKYFIGEKDEIEYYLLFKGKGKNILNKDFLKSLKKSFKKKVVYADKCLIDDNVLESYNIVFKQIPYEVKVY